jgi:hypothetical protein
MLEEFGKQGIPHPNGLLFFNPLFHPVDMLANFRGHLGIIGFRQCLDAIGEQLHIATNLLMIR